MGVFFRLTAACVLLLLGSSVLAEARLLVRVQPANSALKDNIEGHIGSLGERDARALRRYVRSAEAQAQKAAQALGYYQAQITTEVSEDATPRLTVRIQPSKVLDAQIRALGAKPMVIEFSEVLTSLKSRRVDGAENPVSNFYTQNMHHAQKYLTLTDHGYLGYAVITKKEFWDRLPADIRTVLEGALQDATVYANESALQGNAAALEAVKKSGKTQVIELTAAEKSAWRNALKKVHTQPGSRVPKDLIQSIYKETGATP